MSVHALLIEFLLKRIGRVLAGECAKYPALDAAMYVFWEKGFEAASLDDLTKAMGITRLSMYAAFGNKESLFRQALDRYFQGPASYLKWRLHAC